MVNTEGPVEIASSRGDRREDRKVDLIVQEMRRYNVKVTALQKTKWFWSEVYRVTGSVALTSGRKKPAQEDTVKRGGRGSNCTHRLGNRCLEGSREAMEGMGIQSNLSMSTVGLEI